MKTIKSRIAWIDLLKLFAIFLVIYGHIIQHIVSIDERESEMFLFIYSFHMPLFMMISGFFASKIIERSLKQTIIYKFKQLIIPCIIWSAIFLALNVILFDKILPVNYFYYNLWFLKSLFVCVILYYFGYKICNNRLIGITCSIVISQMLSFIPYLVFLGLRYMYPCFIFGLFIYKYLITNKLPPPTAINSIPWLINLHSNKLLILICLISGFLFLVLFINFDAYLLYPPTLISELVTLGNYSTILYVVYYKLVIGITGSLFFILLFYLNRNAIQNKLGVISSFGSLTLQIYLIQSIVVELLARNYMSIETSNNILDIFKISFLSIIFLIVSIIIYKILCKVKLGWICDLNKLKLS